MPFGFGTFELLLVVATATFLIGGPIIILAVVLNRRQPERDPRAVLTERLSRGEISREDFDTSMRALGYVGEPDRPAS